MILNKKNCVKFAICIFSAIICCCPIKANISLICAVSPGMVEKATEEGDLEAALKWSEIYNSCKEAL